MLNDVKTHKLKTLECYFTGNILGIKNFEIRKFDRDFEVGDKLILCEQEPLSISETSESGFYIKPTGRELALEITYMLHNFSGIEDGYVILGTKKC